MKLIELRIPNLGEAEDTEIIEISVKKGDKLKKNDPIIVLESEKAAMEVPSDYEGIIQEIKVKEGDTVKEGNIFAVIKTDTKDIVQEPEEIKSKPDLKTEDIEEPKFNDGVTLNFSGVNAGPAVRKIARELGIDLRNIIGSGKNKMIIKDDLKNHIHSMGAVSKIQYADLKSLEEFGDYKIDNQSKIRRAGAKNLTESWQSIPHVSHFEEADISKIEKQRRDLNEISSVKITPLAYFIKATSLALEEYPLFNSSLVGEGKLMLRKYINIGIAVSTNEGLVVPVIKDVNNLNIGQIAENIINLSRKARDKKLVKSDITGSTFTISSLGAMGGIGFTPIINPPEVAIIGLSRARNVASLENQNFINKTFLPFSLSYDHRVINGLDAGNFMVFVKSVIEKGL